MAAIFTQVHVFQGISRQGQEQHDGRFLIRYDGRLLSIHEKAEPSNPGAPVEFLTVGGLSMTVHSPRIVRMDEDAVEVEGFRRKGDDLMSSEWRPVRVVLTAPGTGWDGKEPS